MLQVIHQRYADHIDQIGQLIAKEITYWNWDEAPQMKALVMRYLQRSGKRLRPLLALLFADLFDGAMETIHWPAAAIEVYHTATLIYDDIQDNSEFRRGQPCAHITASTSTAMNLAAVVRTLMYHFLHQSPHLSTTQKLEVHQRLDHAATLVALGQSIDIGWHEGWYSSYQHFPYKRMIQWKSATLFGCTAAIGTLLSGAHADDVNKADELGTEIGLLFQMVDDFLDVFGDSATMRRPLFNDFREGKVTFPVIYLLTQLSAEGREDKVKNILQCLAERDAQNVNWQWLVDLMLEYGIDYHLRNQFQEQVDQLTGALECMGKNTDAREALRLFIASLIPLASGRSS
jgi:geranylgeranyl pyrophosphate synthase